jgi:hypothetical protein
LYGKSYDPQRKVSEILRPKRCIGNPTTPAVSVGREGHSRPHLWCSSAKDLNFKTESGDWLTIISRRNPEIGLLLALHDQGLHQLCPSGTMPASFMVTTSTRTQNLCIQPCHHGPLKPGMDVIWSPSLYAVLPLAALRCTPCVLPCQLNWIAPPIR